MIDTTKLIEEIKKMSVMELAELVKVLEDEFGVSAAAPAAAAGAGAAAVEAVEEQTEFAVVLKGVGANKINVIKAIRELTGLGLVEAKNMAEGLGTVKEGLPKAEAEKMAAKLKEAGAEVEIK